MAKASGTQSRAMKRHGGLYEKIISIENLKLADEKARKSIKINFSRRIKVLDSQHISDAEYKQAVCGWIGWAKYSDSRNFIKKNIKQQHYESILQSVTSPVGANARRAH